MIIENLPKSVNRASKDILAKCMATEDLRVIHDAKAQTAWFDTESRTLCLPIWTDMSNSVYDMLVGHEVSHALHTPKEGWQSFVGEGRGSRIRHMFLNIVEDARIERMIKDKFPGLRRDFIDAYKHMHNVDMFELKNRSIDLDMPLIDRLNLHFKLGLFGYEIIPFAQDEQQYVTRMAITETFEDVIALAQELYEKHADELEDEDEQQPQSGSQSQSGDEQGEEQGSQGQSNDDTGESQDGSQSGSESEEGDDEDGNASGNDDESGDDSGQSQDDDTDDGEGAESSEGDGEENGEGENSLDYDDYKEGVAPAGSTQNSFEKSIDSLREPNEHAQYTYKKLPQMKLENCVITYKDIEKIWEDFRKELVSKDRLEYHTESRTKSDAKLSEFMNKTKSTVAQMVQQFQMKQAADLDARTSFAKTGVLNTNSMINYRWSEDIFLKNEVHADGKNHGIVMYLDWSGSMHSIIRETVEQLLILTEFCNKVNIPFEVYAFSSQRHPNCEDDTNANCSNWEDKEVLRPHRFCLLQFLSSDMKTKEYKEAIASLYNLSTSSYYSHPSQLGMGCTPLNEAIMCAMTQVPAFKAKHNLQIVNTVLLTDGDGHSMGASSWSRDDKTIIHDTKTRKDYDTLACGGETETYLKMLQDQTGTNLIGIRLLETKRLARVGYRYFGRDDKALKAGEQTWKKFNYALVDAKGYDNLFLIRGDTQVQTDALENLDGDASYTKLRNAFMKGTSNAKGTRVIANKLIDIISQ